MPESVAGHYARGLAYRNRCEVHGHRSRSEKFLSAGALSAETINLGVSKAIYVLTERVSTTVVVIEKTEITKIAAA